MITKIIAIVAIRKSQDGAHPEVSTDEDENLIWHDGNPTNITNQQITDKIAVLQAEYDAKQYQRDRTEYPEKGGYPLLGDQLDMIYHDQVDGTTTFKDAIKAIKDAHPKP
jgi:hypothetical protein